MVSVVDLDFIKEAMQNLLLPSRLQLGPGIYMDNSVLQQIYTSQFVFIQNRQNMWYEQNGGTPNLSFDQMLDTIIDISERFNEYPYYSFSWSFDTKNISFNEKQILEYLKMEDASYCYIAWYDGNHKDFSFKYSLAFPDIQKPTNMTQYQETGRKIRQIGATFYLGDKVIGG